MQFNNQKMLPRIMYKDLMINPFRWRVTMRGKAIDLTAKEFDILYLLGRKQGHALSKQEIYQEVRNVGVDINASVVTDHVSSIRQKLGLNSRANDYLRTIFGVGYCLGWLDSGNGKEK